MRKIDIMTYLIREEFKPEIKDIEKKIVKLIREKKYPDGWLVDIKKQKIEVELNIKISKK